MIILLLLFSASTLFPDTATVARVIDGDTIVLSDSTRVRLIGINTPETSKGRNRTRARQARAALDSLIGGKRIILQYDSHGLLDRFGRRLAYICIDSLDVNLEMIRKGYSAPFLKYQFDRRKEFESYGSSTSADNH